MLITKVRTTITLPCGCEVERETVTRGNAPADANDLFAANEHALRQVVGHHKCQPATTPTQEAQHAD